jgi:hypothetical protein
MKQNLRSNDNKNNGVFGRLAAEKKKTAIAVCLITVMALMWVKVLGRKGPQSANAAIMTQEITEGQMSPELKVSFIELPKVEGRNDILNRDFFTVGSWWDFMKGGGGKLIDGGQEMMDDKEDSSEETGRWLAGKLTLEAIVLGENPQAFINDRLLSVGDKLFVRNGTSMYECEVAKIEENTVSIRCGETEITLRLMQTPIIDK